MKQFVLLLFSLCTTVVFAQDFLDNVNASTFESAKKYDDLEGIVLDEFVSNQVRWTSENNVSFYVLEQTVSKVIKINSFDGAYKAGFYLPIYTSAGFEESFKLLDATVYRLEGNQIKQETIIKSTMFNTKKEASMTLNSLDLSKVAPGSIVTYSYVKTSMYLERLPTYYIREDLAKKKTTFSLSVPSNLDYQILIQSQVELKESSSVIEQRSSSLFGLSSSKERVVQKTFVAQDVAALPFYNYVDNIENYVDKIECDLVSITYPRETPIEILPSMGMFFTELASNRMFYKQINQKNIFKKKLDLASFEGLTQMQKIDKAFDWIQQTVRWNGQFQYLPSGPIKDALSGRPADSAQINLLLLNLLKEVGLQAYPVLISTHENGQKKKWQHNFFNQVLVAVSLNGNVYYMDPSNKFSQVNVLGNSALNVQGYHVNEKGEYRVVSITSPYTSQENTIILSELTSMGTLHSEYKMSYSYNSRIEFLEQFTQQKNTGLIKDLSQRIPGFIFSNLKVTDSIDLKGYKIALVSVQGNKNNAVENFNGKMFFNPFQVSDLRKNPLNYREREIPVYLAYPLEKEVEIHVELPQNYTINNIPSPILISEDALGVLFSITYTLQQNTLICKVKVTTKAGYIPAQYSAKLFDFYGQLAKELNTTLIVELLE